MVFKVCLLRPVYTEIGLNIRRNDCESFFPNRVPDQTSQQNISCFTNSTDDLLRATAIEEVTRVLVIDLMEFIAAGPLSTDLAYKCLDTGYTRMLVLQMVDQVGGVVGDNPCTLHPYTLIILGAIQYLGK